MTPTPPPEGYADLIAATDAPDAAWTRLIGDLDQTLRPHPAPAAVRTALEQLLREHGASASPGPGAVAERGAFSRRQALKAGAASFAFLLTLGHTTPAVRAELARLAGEGPMTGRRLVGFLREERANWTALLARAGAARMEESGVDGEWSIKQLIAHLTWYEEAVLDGARRFQASGKLERRRGEESMDERNTRIAMESQARPLSDVLAEADQVFAHLLALIAGIPDELLNDPNLAGLPEDNVPWMLIANNSYGHYRQHAENVRAWLERTPG